MEPILVSVEMVKCIKMMSDTILHKTNMDYVYYWDKLVFNSLHLYYSGISLCTLGIASKTKCSLCLCLHSNDSE